MRRIVWIVAAIVVLAAAWMFWPRPAELGDPRFFADRTYDFEAIRVLSDIAPAGGDSAEAMQAIAGIRTGDADSWYAAWSRAGDRVTALAARTHDPLSKGDALLRAHTYYRAAEFFLAPHDPRRPAVWKKNTAAFYTALDAQKVAYERIAIPYGAHHLNAVYYPAPGQASGGAAPKPLIMLVGGYDSTMEELYLHLVWSAHRRGFAVLTYEGPGQGSVLREQGLVFTPQWEKPNGAVLDNFLEHHPKPSKIVLVGESMGGYLAPRAAAFDGRIDGVVAYDVFFDGGEIASRSVPKFVFWLRDHGYMGVLKFLSGLRHDPGSDWAQQNGMWTFGLTNPLAVIDAFKAYDLAPVAPRIRQDVLALSGADDHFVPPDQLGKFKASLTGARSVTAVTFDTASGGGRHCQLGAQSVWQATLFDWIAAKFA
jgi:alpha-beta hydrolase superfamily lysophospholipase